MHVEEIMNSDILTIDPEATVQDAAQRMVERDAGAVLVVGADKSRPGIMTERDVLHAVATGQDPSSQRVIDNSTPDVATVPVDSSLEQAVKRMTEGNFRHLVVVHGDDTVGMVSMRDLVLALTSQ